MKKPSFTEWLRDPQTLIGLSAIVLSLCGLSIAIYEASLIRHSQRASVWPHVTVAASMNAGSISLWVKNSGVGPARIQAAAVSYRGEVQESWSQLLDSVLGESRSPVSHSRSFINGQVLPVDRAREILFAVPAEGQDVAEEVIEALHQAVARGELEIEVCYCSVYDECWLASFDDVLLRSRGAAPSGEPLEDGCGDAPVSRI